VLLDIGLPQLDGYEVARRLRADPALKSVKLVATTGYGNEKDLQLAREAGFDAHLIKPVDLTDIEKLLRKWNRLAPEGSGGISR
jgi:CheY-like chemotaxis protein